MSSLSCTLSTLTAGVALASTAAKITVMTLRAPANQILKLKGITFNFHGVSTTDPSIEWFLNYITAGSGTSAGTLTPVNINDRAETPQATGRYGPFSVADTIASQAYQSAAHPQLGIPLYFPFDEPILIGGGKELEFACTVLSGAANTVYATMHYEE